MSENFVRHDGRLTASGQKLLAVAIALCEVVGSQVTAVIRRDQARTSEDKQSRRRDEPRLVYDLTLLLSLGLIWLAKSRRVKASVSQGALSKCLAVANWKLLERCLDRTAPVVTDLIVTMRDLLDRLDLSLEKLTSADLGYIYEALICYEPEITDGVTTDIVLRGGSIAMRHKTVGNRHGLMPKRRGGACDSAGLIECGASRISILKDHRFVLNRQPKRSFLKRQGTFFSPPNVVDYLVKRSFEILFKLEDPKSQVRISTPKVLDPAMGAGHFLLAALDYLSRRRVGQLDENRRKESDFRKRVAAGCIYGTDINYGAVRMARLLVLLHAGYAPSLVRALKRNLVQADVLRCMHPDSDFTAIYFPHLVAQGKSQPGGFDLVLSNPPYFSYSGRQCKGEPGEARMLRGRHELGGWLSSHGIFMVRAAEIANQAGVISMIVPDQVGYLEGYRHVRRRLLELGQLVEVRYWGEDVFARAKTPVMTFCLRKQPIQRQRAIYIRHKTVTDFDPEEGSWYVAPYSDLLRIVSARHRPIGGYLDIGVHTGNVASRIVLGEPIDGSVRLLEGKQVHEFWCEAPRKWLNLNYRAKRGEYFRIAPSRVYEAIDIVLRQTASYPIAARHVHRCHFRNSVLGLRVPSGFSVEYLLGILNSNICHLLFAALSPETHQRTFPQVKIGKLKKLPIPDPCVPGRKHLVMQIESLVRRLEHEAPTLEKHLLDELNSVVCEIYEVSPYVVSSLADHLPG